MFAMIWRIEVYAIPARWEAMINHDATRTRLLRELERLRLSCALVLHADVRQLTEIAGAFTVFVFHGADEHAESGLEGCYFGGLGGVEECVCHVVYHLGL